MAKNLFKIAKQKKIKYFLISFVDLFGVLRSKLVPANALAGTNFDLKTPNRSTKLIKKYFIFFCLAILNKFFAID